MSLNWKSIPPKVNKDIGKCIHINQAVYSKASEVARLLFMMNKINVDFYSKINVHKCTYMEHTNYGKRKFTWENKPRWFLHTFEIK